MFKKILVFVMTVFLIIGGNLMSKAKNLNAGWDKVFPKSDKVEVKKVRCIIYG